MQPWEFKNYIFFDENNLLDNSDQIKETSMGHFNDVDLFPVDNVVKFIDKYENKFATTLAKGSKRIGDPNYNVAIPYNSIILFGGETKGLPREFSRRKGIQKIVIPTKGMDYCLSLPVAYSIVLYEYLRQNPDKFPVRGK